MNRLQLRLSVRQILRDDNYPAESINAAINRVLSFINLLGRFRFHQSSEDITLDGGYYGYDIPSYVLAEELVVFDPDSADKVILLKYPSFVAAQRTGAFTTTAAKPKYYSRWANHILFDPMPDTDAEGKKVRIYYFEDLQPLFSDLAIPLLPDRYHENVLAYGAASEIRPQSVGMGGKTIGQLHMESLQQMINQELWEPGEKFQLFLSDRWRNIARMGTPGSLRG
jgi:hypothetical protein